MHAQLAEAHSIYRMAADVRDTLLAALTDEDLKYVIRGNSSLGMLLASHASIQQSYIHSFKTHIHDWASVQPDPALGASIVALTTAFKTLDEALQTVLEGVTEEEFTSGRINRGGHELEFSLGAQLHTLREALIIVMGKALVYVQAMEKRVPPRVLDWVG